jgi:hypothetical protein
VNSRAQSESDDGPELGSGDESSEPEESPTPEHLVENTVTRIMPIIAPWPEPGAEPPTPPTLPAPRAVGAAPVVSRVDAADTPDVPTTPGTAVVLAPRKSADVVRAGPAAIAEDSWDQPPESILDASSTGGRRSQLPSRRVWVTLVAVLIGLGAVVGVPLVLSSRTGTPPAVAVDESTTALDEPPPGFVPDSTSVQSPPALPVGGSARPAPSASPTRAQPPNPTVQNTVNPPDPPPFEALTIEAETGDMAGTYTRIWENYVPGVNLVRNLGNWGGTPGTLTLNGIVFPSDGDYTITIIYVHPDGETNRSAQVTISGVEPVTVNFVGDSNCCHTTAVSISVPAGTRSITVSNPISHAPSIDKIIISRG